MITPVTVVTSVLFIASLAAAVPTRRSEPFCDTLLATCAKSDNALTNPWSIPACVYGATCFGGSRPVDGFLSAVASAKNASSAPASRDVPRFTVAAFNLISTDKKVLTQQNFIDAVYGTLSATSGPYPDASLVVSSFQRIAVWTAFCDGKVPYNNFADYFQYSASVNSNGCTAVTTVTSAPVPVQTPAPYPVVSSDASCQRLSDTCVGAVDFTISNVWTQNSCLLAATCIGGKGQVDALLAAVYLYKTAKTTGAPTSLTQTRLSTATLKKISTDGSTITQQNWIDAYYGAIAASGGQYPSSAAVVIDEFNQVQKWTAFCGKGIPFKNFADYFQYSSSVSGPTSC